MLNDPFVPGDVLTLDNKTFGTVTEVTCEPYTMQETLSDGRVLTADQGDAYTYIVTVKATLTQKEGFLRAGKDEPIAVGDPEICLPLLPGQGYGTERTVNFTHFAGSAPCRFLSICDKTIKFLLTCGIKRGMI